jgi:hypothetical protein
MFAAVFTVALAVTCIVGKQLHFGTKEQSLML